MDLEPRDNFIFNRPQEQVRFLCLNHKQVRKNGTSGEAWEKRVHTLVGKKGSINLTGLKNSSPDLLATRFSIMFNTARDEAHPELKFNPIYFGTCLIECKSYTHTNDWSVALKHWMRKEKKQFNKMLEMANSGITGIVYINMRESQALVLVQPTPICEGLNVR